MTGPNPHDNPADPVQLSRGSAARARDATVFVERLRRNKAPVGKGPRGGFVHHWKAKTGATGIGVASAADTPGQGTVTLCDWDGTKWVPRPSPVAGVDTVTALNPDDSSPVGANKFVTIAWVSGQWEVILELCP